HTHTHTHTHTNTDKHTHKHTHRQTHTQTHTQKHRQQKYISVIKRSSNVTGPLVKNIPGPKSTSDLYGVCVCVCVCVCATRISTDGRSLLSIQNESRQDK